MSDKRSASPAARETEYEYTPLRIPAEVSRANAAAQLSLHAEFGGWELARVALFGDGSRRVTLRRRVRRGDLPMPVLPR